MGEDMTNKPKPGSPEARLEGCKCPVIDNAHGKGYMGGVKDDKGETMYVINGACPMHGKEYEQGSQRE